MRKEHYLKCWMISRFSLQIRIAKTCMTTLLTAKCVDFDEYQVANTDQ